MNIYRTCKDDLQFTKHLADKVKKANSMSGLIHRSFQYMTTICIYISTRLSEYVSSVWSPFKLRNIKLIEGVQRRATILSRDLRIEPYHIRLTTLGLSTLQLRRDGADMFKILSGYEVRLHKIGSKRHSLQAVDLSQRTQAAVQIVSNLPAPINGGPIYRFFWACRPCRPAGWLALLLRKAGDVETNPGPTTLNKKVWICDICHKQIHVRKQISIRCNRIEHWVHLRCGGIFQAQYTDTWTCHLHR